MDKEREALEQQARVKGKKGYTVHCSLYTFYSFETPNLYVGI